MSRSAISDPFQVHKFWLFDASFVDQQIPVLSPLLGFSRISMPEISLESQEIREANWLFSKKVIKSGSISNITLETASTFINSDFWKWTVATITGDTSGSRWFSGISKLPQIIGGPSPRKNLVLVQFFAHNPFGVRTKAIMDRIANRSIRRNTDQTPDRFDEEFPNRFGPGELYPQIPGKAWVLYGCLPTRMKPGSDFDANSAEISIQELEVGIESIEEISLADPF